MKKKLRLLSLFSGIGAPEFALEQAGNSICIPVLAALFGAMKEQGMFDKYITMP